MRVIRLIACLCLSLCVCGAVAQVKSDRYKPKWMTKGVPKQTDAYLFERAYGDGSSLDEARQQCFVNLVTKLEHERGIVVTSRLKASSHVSRDNYTKNKDFSMECEESGKAISLVCRTVDEYWTQRNGHYGCSLLYSVANMAYTDRPGDMVYVTSSYGARGLWRSMIIPGWGQFHKGANLKGGLILGGTAVLAGGIVFTENQRAGYLRRMRETHDINLIRRYKTKRDNFATTRNVCIGAAAALYVYNLIDAVAAPGARRVVTVRGAGGRSYAFMPALSADGTPVMTAAVTF